MSDKNLTELEWKKFSKGKGYKDAAFVKAIAALEKARDPEAQLAALDEIDKQAEALRKANKADKELTSYLDDTDKASGKERKLAEFEAKKAAKKEAESGDDEEESPALLTGKMIPLLRQVRKGDEMKAMVAVAGKDVAVLVSKRSIAPTRRKLLQDYLGVSGGVKFAVGECIWEENAHTFVLQTQAAGLAKKIKAAILAQTEMRLKVRVRGEDPADIDDDGEPAEHEQDEGESTEGTTSASTIPPAPPLPPTQPTPQATQQATPDADTAAFNTRLAALMPRVKETIVGAGAHANDVKLKVSEAGVFARKKEFPQAHALLDETEKLMALGGTIPEAPPLGTAGTPTPTATPAPQDAEAAAFNARLAALMPKVKEALVAAGPSAAELKLKVSEAGVTARKKEFAQANALLDEAEKLMAPSAPAADAGAFEARLAAIEARYQSILKNNPVDANKMRAVFGYAGEQAEAGAYAKAIAALGQLEKLLDAAGGGAEQGYTGIVAYRKTLLDLRAAVAKVEGQIAGLVKAIPDQMPDEADLAEELAEDLRESNEELQDLVDEAMGTAENEDTPITRELTARLDELIAEVAGNAVIKHVDKNPFGVALNIEATLSKALKDVRAALPVTA